MEDLRSGGTSCRPVLAQGLPTVPETNLQIWNLIHELVVIKTYALSGWEIRHKNGKPEYTEESNYRMVLCSVMMVLMGKVH